MELTNFDTLQKTQYRPELLFSGELHGDEVIGPQVVLAYIEYMALNYHTDPFVTRMVDTRLVTLVPMTNAIGFFNGQRTELQGEMQYDPNRDFGFDQVSTKCMQTVAARALNELFRVHIFRLLITFHGGTNVVGYEWGDTSHCDGNICKPAPDTFIMKALGERMSQNAGSAGHYEAAYPVGDMGKTVYSVNGGLEDWAYGASWAKEATSCNPSTLGGYPVEKTKIERITKRCVTYLVETAREKKPDPHTLGTDENILQRGATGDGHVPRNIRLLLTVVDAAEPYIVLDREAKQNGQRHPTFSWVVGGAFVVTGTMIQWSSINGTRSGLTTVVNGTAGVATAGGTGTQFTQALPLGEQSFVQPIYIRIAAVVDKEFSKQPEGSSPDVSPQSHLMASRASATWQFSAGDRKVQGKLVVFSGTIRVSALGNGQFARTDAPDVKWNAEQEPGTLHTASDVDLYKTMTQDASPRLVPVHGSMVSMRTTILTGVGGVVAVLAVAIAIYVFVRRKRLRGRRKGGAMFSLADDMDFEETRSLAQADDSDRDQMEGITTSRSRKQDPSHV